MTTQTTPALGELFDDGRLRRLETAVVAVIVAVLLLFVPVLLYEIPLNVILPDLVKLLL